MKVKLVEASPKAEYSVEFESVSTFLAYFRDVPGLTDQEIVDRALQIARGAFGNGGTLTIERTSRDGSFAFQALGVDRESARILGKPSFLRPKLQLRLVKGAASQKK